MKSKHDQIQQKQMRFTLEDTLKHQDKLKEKLKILISMNRPLEYKEKKSFFEMITKGLLSQGCTDSVYFVHEGGWFIFESLQSLFHRVADLTTNQVMLKTSKPKQVEITIPISELWSFLYRKSLYLFPQSCAEALHISQESIERPKQGTFKFTSKEDLL